MAIAVPQHSSAVPDAVSGVVSDTLPRRAVWALWGTLAAGTALAGAGALGYLWPRGAFDAGDAGAVAAYRVGQARYFPGQSPAVDLVRREGYFVVRRQDGFVAFAAFCTHQVANRCNLVWHESVQPNGTEGQFFCPCHGGAWRQDTGDPITTAPPFPYAFVPHHAPALPLVSLPIHVDHGRVHVGLGSGVKYRQLYQPPLLART